MREPVRQEQLQAFLTWLPTELQNAPGIDWTLLPEEVRAYCLRAVPRASPDVPYMALAAATACATVNTNSLLQLLRNLHALLTTFRSECGMAQIPDLNREALWKEFAAKTQETRSRSMQLSAYSAVSTKHYPRYLHGLVEADDFFLMQQYQFPPLPDGYLRRVGQASDFNNSSRLRQQPIRELLLPLYPTLLQLVWLRKQQMERVLHAYSLARSLVESGATLPFAFQQTVLIPSLAQQNGTRTWELQQRERTLHFLLWEKRSWVLGHRDRYTQATNRKAETARGTYDQQRPLYFVEVLNPASDLLWFGQLIEQRILKTLKGESQDQDDATSLQRRQLAKKLGCANGCVTGIPGLLQAGTAWLAEHQRTGDLLFEPQALYRGVLYGAALATLAMSNGNSIGELLQVSAPRWVMTAEGTFQSLLPERAKTDLECRLFEVSPQGIHLLQEIEQNLLKAHGAIPVLSISRQVSSFEHMEPEPYFFQWNTSTLSRRDVEILITFLLHGLDLSTTDGAPLRLNMEHLRYGGNVSLGERARVLKSTLGFNHTILAPLSDGTLDTYCRSLYAYFSFAGYKKEAMLQTLTLARWMVQMLDLNYERETINRHVSIVQHIFEAAASQGFIDQQHAAALQEVEKIAAETVSANNTELQDRKPHLTFSSQFKTCGKLDCSICQEGEKRGHGPYWYGFWYEDGQQHSFYIGRAKNDRRIAEALAKKVEQLRKKRAAATVAQRRALQAEALVPYVPALCQLVCRREQLAMRMLAAFQEASANAASLPLRFQFAEFIPTCDEQGTLKERVVVLRFTLWDKRNWVLEHRDRYSEETIRAARTGTYAYRADRNARFVQYHGPVDGLWFGDLLEQNLLRMLEPRKDVFSIEHIWTIHRAHVLGFPRGCHTSRPGLLDSSDRWFAENAHVGELIFEPTALYRGVLYGSALALLMLSAGMGIRDLLQVRADQWVVSTTAGVSDEQSSVVNVDHSIQQQGTLTGKVPEEPFEGMQRQFSVSQEAKAVLDAIERGLHQAHGEIPLVMPHQPEIHPSSPRPAPLLFQWNASTDGRSGILHAHDVSVLITFVLHSVSLTHIPRLSIATVLSRTRAAVSASQQERELWSIRDALLAPLARELKPSSLQSYRRHLLAYLLFAESREQAFQPETLRRWIDDLAHNPMGTPYTPDAIDQRATVVRRSMVKAGKMGQLDQVRAQAFNAIRVQRHADGVVAKRGPTPKAKTRAHPNSNSLPAISALTGEDEAWIVKQCRQNPAITALELRERLQVERGKTVSKREVNVIRARHNLQRPRNSPPSVQPRRPTSYKLDEADLAWLLQQKRKHPALSAAKLRVALKNQRGKEIGERAINGILLRYGLSGARGGQTRQVSEDAAVSPPYTPVPGKQVAHRHPRSRGHNKTRAQRSPSVCDDRNSPHQS